MNKMLIVLTMVNLFWACSHTSGNRHVSRPDDDLLLKESYQRYSREHILQEIADRNGRENGGLTLRCYGGNVEKQLEQVKKDGVKNIKQSAMWIDLGNCYFLKGELARARFYYRYALTTPKITSRQRALIYNNLGVIAQKVDNLGMAEGLFARAAKEDQTFLTPRFNLSHLYLKRGDWNQSRRYLEQLVKQGSSDVDILFALGALHLFKQQYIEANRYFAQIDPVYYQRESISNFYSFALMKSGQLNLALKIWERGERTGGDASYSQLASTIRRRIEQRLEEERLRHKGARSEKEQADG